MGSTPHVDVIGGRTFQPAAGGGGAQTNFTAAGSRGVLDRERPGDTITQTLDAVPASVVFDTGRVEAPRR
jgi:hypothetical protein